MEVQDLVDMWWQGSHSGTIAAIPAGTDLQALKPEQ